jgi:hypothetical protein
MTGCSELCASRADERTTHTQQQRERTQRTHPKVLRHARPRRADAHHGRPLLLDVLFTQLLLCGPVWCEGRGCVVRLQQERDLEGSDGRLPSTAEPPAAVLFPAYVSVSI